ncbi:MAG TPA: site-2 protease family protein [Candidatus Dormibacteraeota bacterium]|nr:site-2 protease family protein [Candidatus Dormibacteraeota bacterium]
MRASVTLGRIAGIEIGLNWSLAIAFFLFAGSLAGDVFPLDVPGYSGTSYFIASVIAVILFYASLLAHELGHALVARRLGTRVDGITLWLFGGVARLSGDAVSDSAELRITLVGPAITVVVAIIFAVISAALGTFNLFPLTADMFAWLARINFLLAVFNLIPAFPLDGGRVLRALLWRFTHDQVRATSIAAWLGRGFGALMILGGFYLILFANSLINGVWFSVLGWFLFSAAGSQELQTRLHRSLAGVRVRDVMTPDPITAPDWIRIDDFVTRFATDNRATAYPVRDFNGQLSGLVTLHDLARVAGRDHPDAQLRTIARALDRVPIAHPEDPLEDVVQKIDDPEAGYILVLDSDRLVGMVTPADINRAVQMAGARSQTRSAGLSATS